MNDLQRLADFLFEAGMLAKTPRSGFAFLGTGQQSVAEHITRVAMIGYVLSGLDGKVDCEKILKLCLFHDFHEARVADQNYMNKKYNAVNLGKAVTDLSQGLPFGTELKALIKEFEANETKEAKLANDADQLELLLILKEEIDTGHRRAKTWLPAQLKRLQTEAGKRLAAAILKTPSDRWWIGDTHDEWWVHGGKKAGTTV